MKLEKKTLGATLHKNEDQCILGGDTFLRYLESLTFAQLLDRYRASTLPIMVSASSGGPLLRRPLTRDRLVNILYYHTRALEELYGSNPLKRKRTDEDNLVDSSTRSEEPSKIPRSNILFRQEIARRYL